MRISQKLGSWTVQFADEEGAIVAAAPLVAARLVASWPSALLVFRLRPNWSHGLVRAQIASIAFLASSTRCCPPSSCSNTSTRSCGRRAASNPLILQRALQNPHAKARAAASAAQSARRARANGFQR